MDDLVSVIVPVYNVAQYLDRCLNSLVQQSYQNLEILLIDDGSTDGSGALCDGWQRRDPRIRVFHKPNGGLSDARNHGLERAAGEFICFVDSDDWCDTQFVERMLTALRETGADVVECSFLPTDGASPLSGNIRKKAEAGVFTGRECFRRFLAEDFFVSVCTKLYRRSLLEGLPFRKGVYHEDEVWTYRIFSRVQTACRLDYTGYYYFQRPGSIDHTALSRKRLTDAFEASKERMKFIELHYPEFASLGYEKAMYTCMYLYRHAERADFPERTALQEELLLFFRYLFRNYLKRGKYRKRMWRFIFFRLSPKRYCNHYS